MAIYKRLNAVRATCMQEFRAIHTSESTCATYYNLCFKTVQSEQNIETAKVRAAATKRKFSSVKPKRGTTEASHVQMFMTRKAAAAFNNQNAGFNNVVPGEQVVGKEIGTTNQAA